MSDVRDAILKELLRVQPDEFHVTQEFFANVRSLCQEHALLAGESDLSIKLIIDYRQQLAEAQRQLGIQAVDARNRASDCAEHIEDLTRSQIKLRQVEARLVAVVAALEHIKQTSLKASCYPGEFYEIADKAIKTIRA